MWTPTHAQVIVQKAKGLPVKGKHGNEAYVVITLGKEKFETSVQKNETPEWHEECDLMIPNDNTACIVLSVYHRNFVGLDKFLGQVKIPLQEFDFYERPRDRWYPLRGKSSSKKEAKNRGELEARVAFIVKNVTGSLLDISAKKDKKHFTPISMAKSVGGSLMNLGKERKESLHQPFKQLSKMGHKISDKLPGRKWSSRSDLKDSPAPSPQLSRSDIRNQDMDGQSVISSTYSEDQDSLFDAPGSTFDAGYRGSLGNVREGDIKNSGSVLLSSQSTLQLSNIKPADMKRVSSADLTSKRVRALSKDFEAVSQEDVRLSTGSLPTDSRLTDGKLKKNKANLISHMKGSTPRRDSNVRTSNANIPKELLQKYEKLSKEELLELMYGQQLVLEKQMKHIGDLEDYIDNMLVRVMEVTPKILQNPFEIKGMRRSDSGFEDGRPNGKWNPRTCNYL